MYYVDEYNAKYFNGDDFGFCGSDLALFLIDNPDCIYMKDGGKFLFVYSSRYKKFLYRNPSNLKRNKWYLARGLECCFSKDFSKFCDLLVLKIGGALLG